MHLSHQAKMLAVPSQSYIDRIRARPLLGRLFQKAVAYLLILAGLAYIVNPVNASLRFGVMTESFNGLRHIKAFYGGGQIGIGLFILNSKSREAFSLILYAMSLLATARCLCSVPFILEIWPLTFGSDTDKFVHLAIALMVEYPCAFLAAGALQIWENEHAQENLLRARILAKELGMDLSRHDVARALRFLLVVHLCLIGVTFLMAPRWMAESYELYAAYALGIIEFQSMFGMLRIALAVFLVSNDNIAAVTFFVTVYGSTILCYLLASFGII